MNSLKEVHGCTREVRGGIADQGSADDKKPQEGGFSSAVKQRRDQSQLCRHTVYS